MGLLSKAWKGVKKAVKTVAKGVKKVAKGITTSLPGGQKLWKASGKLGKNIMKGISKIGPVGMIAIQAILSVTGVGAIIASTLSTMWSGFGTAAAAAAQSANALVSAIGTVGSGLYATGNFIAGTLGAVGNAVSEGASQLASGNFSAAANAFGSNLGSALSGEAGMASVHAAAAQAASASGTLLGQGMEGVQATIAESSASGLGPDALNFDPSATDISSISSDIATEAVSDELSIGTIDELAKEAASKFATEPMKATAEKALYGKAGELSLAETGAYLDYGKTGVQALQPVAANIGNANQETLKKGYDKANKYLGGSGGAGTSGQVEEQSSLIVKPLNTQAIRSATPGRGQGSEGFSLLSGVRGLESTLRNSQNLMFT